MVPDSIRRRVDIPQRLPVRTARTVGDTRYQAVRRSADMETRLSKLERFVGFLTNMLLGMISACFAIAGATYAAGGFYWQEAISSAVLAFLIAMWLADVFFPTTRCLE